MSVKGEVLIEIKDMCKNFGVTVALSHVDMEIRRGEIRGLIGENGSGKSTISSIIAGIQQASSGMMYYRGKEWTPNTALEAVNVGIGMIVQEAGTIANVTVAENMFLGNYGCFRKGFLIDFRKMCREAQEALEEIGIYNIQARDQTGRYDMQERKLIEVAKVFHNHPEVIIVDETTTALSQTGRELLYKLMHKAAGEDKAVIFISHDLEELMEHCDALTILRDGIVIDQLEREQFVENDIKHKMVGREIKGDYYRNDMDGYRDEIVLKADCITTLHDIMCLDMELHKGEILGIGGLSECGMHELGYALYGLEEVVDGEVVLVEKGKVVKNARRAFRYGMGYVSKNRDLESLDLNASIGANIQSAGYEHNRVFGPFVSARKEKRYARLQVDQLAIKCNSILQPVKKMSGGNKQKVVFGKWIGNDADILIVDCPTRGVDIGVKASMYQLLYEMKKKGKSIIMISEEMSELIGMTDRILILKDGRINGEFFRKDGYDQHALIQCMV